MNSKSDYIRNLENRITVLEKKLRGEQPITGLVVNGFARFNNKSFFTHQVHIDNRKSSNPSLVVNGDSHITGKVQANHIKGHMISANLGNIKQHEKTTFTDGIDVNGDVHIETGDLKFTNSDEYAPQIKFDNSPGAIRNTDTLSINSITTNSITSNTLSSDTYQLNHTTLFTFADGNDEPTSYKPQSLSGIAHGVSNDKFLSLASTTNPN